MTNHGLAWVALLTARRLMIQIIRQLIAALHRATIYLIVSIALSLRSSWCDAIQTLVDDDVIGPEVLESFTSRLALLCMNIQSC